MSNSGDRHLRQDPLGIFNSSKVNKSAVRVVIEQNSSILCATQHLAQMLVNLLSRQYEVVDEVVISCPPETRALPQCFLYNSNPSVNTSLSEQLLNIIHEVGGDEIIGRSETSEDETLPTIFVGEGGASGTGKFYVNVVASGWEFFVSTSATPPSHIPDALCPIGPFLAASYATSAVFRFLHGVDASTEVFYDAWAFLPIESFSGFDTPEKITLPPTYVIGVGAVGGALAFTLAAMSSLSGDIILIDDGTTDTTNRNRLLTMKYNDIDADKVKVASILFRNSRINVFENKIRWPDYTICDTRKKPSSLDNWDNKNLYCWILSCVDKNNHRRNIAKLFPLHTLGGSTHGTTAQVAYYSMASRYECLACNHPVPDVPPTEEVRTILLTMSLDDRLKWYSKFGENREQIAAIEEYISEPTCGKLGEIELARIGREGETEWSVGFASVAAGVILAATFIKAVLEGTEVVFRASNQRFAWFPSGLGESVALRNNECPLCCSPDRIARFQKKWSG